MYKPVFQLVVILAAILLGWWLATVGRDHSVTNTFNQNIGASIEKPVTPVVKSDTVSGLGQGQAIISNLNDEVNSLEIRVKSLENKLLKIDESLQYFSKLLVQNQGSELAFDTEELLIDEIQKQNEAIRMRGSVIEQNFNQQAIDAKWSQLTTEKIYRVFEDESLAKISVQDVDCRTNQCRIEISSDNSDIDFASSLALMLGEILPSMTTQQWESEDGAFHTSVYLAREGYKFPDPN